MKRILLFLLLPVLGFCQGVPISGAALKSLNGQTFPFANATITVCAASTSGIPCSTPLVGALFQDSGLTIPQSDPFIADQNGNFLAFIAPGNYTVSVSGSGFAGYSYQIAAQCPLNGTCTWTGTNIFNGLTSITAPVITNPQTTGADAGIETLQNKTLQGATFAGTITGNLALVNKISSYGNVTTVSNGVPALLAKADATLQGANIGSTLLYAVPSSGAGFYRVSCYLVLTRQATTSSTLPNCAIAFTDADTATPVAATQFTNGSTANALGTTNSAAAGGTIGTSNGMIIFNAAGSTNINYSTLNYASSGATSMQYAIHLKLEYLGQ